MINLNVCNLFSKPFKTSSSYPCVSNTAISLGCAFIIKEIYSSSIILFSLISFILAWTFISLQIKEFRNMGFSINDSIYSSIFFFLTGLHFFHVVVGIILISILFWSCSYNYIIWYHGYIWYYL